MTKATVTFNLKARTLTKWGARKNKWLHPLAVRSFGKTIAKEVAISNITLKNIDGQFVVDNGTSQKALQKPTIEKLLNKAGIAEITVPEGTAYKDLKAMIKSLRMVNMFKSEQLLFREGIDSMFKYKDIDINMNECGHPEWDTFYAKSQEIKISNYNYSVADGFWCQLISDTLIFCGVFSFVMEFGMDTKEGARLPFAVLISLGAVFLFDRVFEVASDIVMENLINKPLNTISNIMYERNQKLFSPFKLWQTYEENRKADIQSIGEKINIANDPTTPTETLIDLAKEGIETAFENIEKNGSLTPDSLQKLAESENQKIGILTRLLTNQQIPENALAKVLINKKVIPTNKVIDRPAVSHLEPITSGGGEPRTEWGPNEPIVEWTETIIDSPEISHYEHNPSDIQKVLIAFDGRSADYIKKVLSELEVLGEKDLANKLKIALQR